eukprot:2574-Prymnesium_polylepis.1
MYDEGGHGLLAFLRAAGVAGLPNVIARRHESAPHDVRPADAGKLAFALWGPGEFHPAVRARAPRHRPAQ